MKNCIYCHNVIEEGVDFCPCCGEPLSSKAKEVTKLKLNSVRLETINKLLDLVDDEETLKKINKLVASYK